MRVLPVCQVLPGCKLCVRAHWIVQKWVKLWKIVIHGLTFERQVAKSIRTLELNFNFLSNAPHAAQLMGVVKFGRSHAMHAAKYFR